MSQETDIVVEMEGPASTVVVLRGVTDAGTAWLAEHVPAEEIT